MPTSYPLSGNICYEVEDSYNGGFHTTPLRFSDSVTDVRIETGEINTELRDISSVNIVDFQRTMVDPTLHVEYVWQPRASTEPLSEFYTRTDCDLPSLAIQVGVSTCSAGNTAYYILSGCKAKSFTLSSSKGEVYTVAVDFSVASMYVSTSSVTTYPVADVGTDYAAFNNAGSITWTGVTGAYITQGFSITVDNGLNDYYNVGSFNKVISIPGQRSVTGTCDISLDAGGDTHFGEVLNADDITSLALNSGCTTGDHGTITLQNGRFDSTSIDVNTSGEGIITSVPFTFSTVSFSTGT